MKPYLSAAFKLSIGALLCYAPIRWALSVLRPNRVVSQEALQLYLAGERLPDFREFGIAEGYSLMMFGITTATLLWIWFGFDKKLRGTGVILLIISLMAIISQSVTPWGGGTLMIYDGLMVAIGITLRTLFAMWWVGVIMIIAVGFIAYSAGVIPSWQTTTEFWGKCTSFWNSLFQSRPSASPTQESVLTRILKGAGNLLEKRRVKREARLAAAAASAAAVASTAPAAAAPAPEPAPAAGPAPVATPTAPVVTPTPAPAPAPAPAVAAMLHEEYVIRHIQEKIATNNKKKRHVHLDAYEVALVASVTERNNLILWAKSQESDTATANVFEDHIMASWILPKVSPAPRTLRASASAVAPPATPATPVAPAAVPPSAPAVTLVSAPAVAPPATPASPVAPATPTAPVAVSTPAPAVVTPAPAPTPVAPAAPVTLQQAINSLSGSARTKLRNGLDMLQKRGVNLAPWPELNDLANQGGTFTPRSTATVAQALARLKPHQMAGLKEGAEALIAAGGKLPTELEPIIA